MFPPFLLARYRVAPDAQRAPAPAARLTGNRRVIMETKGTDRIRILGFAGSLRKGSYNRMLLRAARELAPENVEIEIFDLEGIPLFNQDFEANPHEKVTALKEKIRAADGLLIVTPEYNYSIPGVLKNAIDAASRPYGTSPFGGKPVAIMSASTGMLGGARAQYHLRQALVFLDAHPLNAPEIMVAFAPEKFDPTGRLTDETTRGKVAELLVRLAEWIERLEGRERTESKKAAVDEGKGAHVH
jgi:chromate reductase